MLRNVKSWNTDSRREFLDLRLSSRIFQAAVHGNTEMRMLVPPNGTSLSLSVAAAHLAWGCVQSTGEGGGWAVMLEPFQ